MHDEIIKFSLDGEIADSNIVETRERQIQFLETQIRDSNAVPVLDMDPQFTLDYRPETETYRFELTMYGVEVGEDDVWQTAGMMSGKMIMKYTPQIRSKGF